MSPSVQSSLQRITGFRGCVLLEVRCRQGQLRGEVHVSTSVSEPEPAFLAGAEVSAPAPAPGEL